MIVLSSRLEARFAKQHFFFFLNSNPDKKNWAPSPNRISKQYPVKARITSLDFERWKTLPVSDCSLIT